MAKQKKPRKDNLADQSVYEDYKNAIPEEEIWTYRVEGLQAPHVNKSYKNARTKKIIVVIVLVVAISLSIFMSVRVVHNDTYKYEELGDGTFEFVKFSNPGGILELNVSYADDDTKKPISVIHEYAFNCDEQIRKISIGPRVKQIDGKSFYSCYALREIRVDPENEWYCDLDGVLYTKDLTQVVCYPIDHDAYLREKYGYEEQYWPTENWKKDGLDKYNDKYTEKYEREINTYVLPDTVKTVGMLAFNYSELFRVYLPEGLETLETMCFFRNWHLEKVFSYAGEKPAEQTGAVPTKDVKDSLPDSLKTIGSDCFNSAIEMDYMYIPANVTEIGHHAFWGAARKEDGGLIGLYEIYAALDEDAFKAQVKTGDQWTGEYDGKLFPKTVPVVYGKARGETNAQQSD